MGQLQEINVYEIGSPKEKREGDRKNNSKKYLKA